MQRRPTQLGVGTLTLSRREKELVAEVLESNRLSYGPKSRAFERDFAKAHGSIFGIFVNSGTSALSIAVACLKEIHGWNDGDEVLVPALTFVATANVVLDHGLRPVFVDCDPRTYNIDPQKIEAAITARTRMILPVHLFGLIADMDPIMEIAKDRKLQVLEDSCETMGVTYKGHTAGSFGAISCFSTYVAHLIVTGVGGLAVTSDAHYAEVLRSIANHGRDAIYVSIDDDKDIDGAAFQEVIRRRFRFVRRGYSFRATELEAAIGIGQLERLPEVIAARQKNAAVFTHLLQPFTEWLQLPWFDASIQEHAFMMYPIVIKESAPFSKEELVMHLERWNVETRDMLPLINQPVYASMGIIQKAFPVADWVNRCGLYIGCHQGMTESDLAYIADVFREFFLSKKLL
jgi:dTDP-4-amino-4,6-dideoxygalactose transaminase